jgi:hypothetical protein
MKAAGLGDGPMFDFPLAHEQIADATGLTAVHTNRTLQALRNAGIISLTSSKLTILDWDALAEAISANGTCTIRCKAAYHSGFGGRCFSRVTVPAIT